MNQALKCFLRIVLGPLAIAFAQAAPLEQLFLPDRAGAAVKDVRGAKSTPVPGFYSRQFNPAAMKLMPGEEIELVLPNGTNYPVVFDRKESHPNRDETWVGHVKSSAGTDHRVLITVGKASTVGRFRTPAGNFLLRTENGKQWLVDPVEAGHKGMQIDKEGRMAPGKPLSQHQGLSAERSLPEVASAQSSSPTIDIAVLYPPSMVSRFGSVSGVETRINFLVAITNQSYIDSGIAAKLRLVHTEQIYYPDRKNLDLALDALSASEIDPGSASMDISTAGVKAMRDRVGADLVSLVRPFNTAVDDGCGMAWMITGSDDDAKQLGYSVVNDGPDAGGTEYYCSDYTFAHELGHNMGSVHDRENAHSSGAYPYSYGFGIEGVFGTIMSYIDPTVGKFSSPWILCNGYVCGIANWADNARSINNRSTAIANFRQSARPQSLGDVPQSGWWWNAAEPGRGYFIEVKNGRFYIANYLYDSSGNAFWQVSGPGSISAATLSGSLSTYSGGQTLTGPYKSPTGPSSAGSMSVSFSNSTHGTITWPGGSVPITRYELATGSLSLPEPSFKPETGWWWNASEGGRGFSIEIQGDNLFIGGFMYDGSGNPVWYVSAGKMSSPSVYQGAWTQYWNGQSMGGVFKMATVKTSNVGAIAIGFTSTTTATLHLPDGTSRSLTRYSF